MAGPEVSCFIDVFETMLNGKDTTISTKHYEQTLYAQKSFIDKVEALSEVLNEISNLFQEESNNLLVLDIKDGADKFRAKMAVTHQH